MSGRGSEPGNIVPMAAAFEASLAVVALGLGWLLNTHPLATWKWEPAALGWGLVAVIPLFALLWLMVRFPVGPLGSLVKIVDELVVSMFQQASLFDLAMISLMAGIGEEFLFRGFLQAWFVQLTGSQWIGLIGAGVLFGLIHSITRTYAVVAAVVGVYLGGLWMATGNLLSPVVAHAVYDFGALWYLRHTSKRRVDRAAAP
jgi:uncharacterized protein